MKYSYQLTQENNRYTFIFTTNKGISYDVTFTKSLWIPHERAFEISIYNNINSSKNVQYDNRILPTIVAIIEDFFYLNPMAAIGYICDSRDSQQRGAARARLFQQWFENCNTNRECTHLVGIVRDSELGYYYYNGILVLNNNPILSELKEVYYLLNAELTK